MYSAMTGKGQMKKQVLGLNKLEDIDHINLSLVRLAFLAEKAFTSL